MGYRFTVAGLSEGSSDAYPQTPAPLSDLHFLPRPPTDTLHLLQEEYRNTAMLGLDKPSEILTIGYWERLGRFPSLLCNSRPPCRFPVHRSHSIKKTQKEESSRHKSQLCHNHGWNGSSLPTKRQEGSSGGNLGKFIFSLFGGGQQCPFPTPPHSLV